MSGRSPDSPSPRTAADAKASATASGGTTQPTRAASRVVEPSSASAAADVFGRRTAELEPLYDAAIATLTWGFRAGAALLAGGIVLALAKQEPLERVAEPFADIVPAIRDGRAAGVVDVAILWMVATPVAAVLVVAVGFARLGDRRYVLLSLLVLAVLGVSVALALAR